MKTLTVGLAIGAMGLGMATSAQAASTETTPFPGAEGALRGGGMVFNNLKASAKSAGASEAKKKKVKKSTSSPA